MNEAYVLQEEIATLREQMRLERDVMRHRFAQLESLVADLQFDGRAAEAAEGYMPL